MTHDEKVATAIAELQLGAFRYGETDCCQFAARVIEKVSGKVFGEMFEYTSEEEAIEIIGRQTLREFISGVVSASPVRFEDALSGDPVLVDSDNSAFGYAIGIKFRESVAVKTKRSVVLMSKAIAICAWRVV